MVLKMSISTNSFLGLLDSSGPAENFPYQKFKVGVIFSFFPKIKCQVLNPFRLKLFSLTDSVISSKYFNIP